MISQIYSSVQISTHPEQIAAGRPTLLSQEKLESSLEGNALARPLVVGGESRRVGGLCDLSLGNLLEGVEAVALSVESVHKMHCGGCDVID